MSSTPKFVDRVQAVSTTTGTGTYTLGAAVTGFQGFSAVGDGISCYYCAHEVDGSGVPSGGWEVGVGTYTAAGTTLTRDSVLASSNSGAAVSWSAGTRRLMVVAPADLFTQYAAVVETAITGAITLTAAAFGKSYVCSGTSANYTVGLPTAVGHAGERIKLRMSNALTKLVTLDGNSTETLDGLTTRILWAGEACELLSDGTNWVKVAGVSRPMGAVLTRATDQTSIAATTWTAVVMTSQLSGCAHLWDSGNGRATIVRPGRYRVAGAAYVATIAPNYLYTNVGLNGPGNAYVYGSQFPTTFVAAVHVAAVGDYFVLGVYPAVTATVTGSPAAPLLIVEEVDPW